jgi:hypothetical protein
MKFQEDSIKGPNLLIDTQITCITLLSLINQFKSQFSPSKEDNLIRIGTETSNPSHYQPELICLGPYRNTLRTLGFIILISIIGTNFKGDGVGSNGFEPKNWFKASLIH